MSFPVRSVVPTTTIFPSGASASPATRCEPGISMIRWPPSPKAMSTVPFGWRRITAGSACPLRIAVPATTIFPLAWRAIARAALSPPRSTTAAPSPSAPNDGSIVPCGARSRTTA